MKGWQYRWFVLDDNAGLFSYYTSKEKMRRGVRRGCVRLRGALVGIDDEDDSTFTITVDNKTFHFQAKDSEERERWIRGLEDTVLRHNQLKRRSGSTFRKQVVRMEDFDKKLVETDAYLQLLIDQNSSLRVKIEATEDEESRGEYSELTEKVTDMIETVKHAIVLLQIAKNASCPVEGTCPLKDISESPPSSTATPSLSTTPTPQKTPIHTVTAPSDDFVDATLRPIIVGVEEGAECQEVSGAQKTPLGNQLSISGMARQNSNYKNASTVPEISYSSSDDDDDDFFDAQDEEEEAKSNAESDSYSDVLAVTPTHTTREGPPAAPSPTVTPVSPVTPSAVDYDALYEEEEDNEELDMKSQGSVITHLLSQVRIGMDLTKIVLPTFILERRSLLEMYAEFFAHPDVFTDIAIKTTPEERMIQTLKWYLSSFHAGRRSAVAKKPYNPILGEIFRCHWLLDPPEKESDPVPESPLPWCTNNDLVFLAEQVSHHPPISAFYVENASRNISFNAHIYTKSSFLGMSVAVHNVGEGRVSLLDHGEDYVATFPSGYARSILSTPWVELGGKPTITCPQTGYRVELEFKCKQFFSSECNKVTAEVFSKDARKPFLKVDGEWNGKMVAKWTNSGKSETFLDVTKHAPHKKICRKIDEQEKCESRRQWREVTAGLKFGDIEAATNAKIGLEQKQRDDAAERKESGVKWENKYFKSIGGNWVFTKPLASRKK